MKLGNESIIAEYSRSEEVPLLCGSHAANGAMIIHHTQKKSSIYREKELNASHTSALAPV